MNMFKKNGGFTLVELIVVIAILAILAAVAVPAYSGYINEANKVADTTLLSAVKTACQAALATEGEVTKITVLDADTDKITVEYKVGESTKTTVILGGSDDDVKTGATAFANYFNDSIALDTGCKAVWDGSKWEITGAPYVPTNAS